jgi:hypothetical protein
MILRVRTFWPFPQDLLQEPQAPKLEVMQSTAQACLLQLAVSVRGGHVGPNLGRLMMKRVLVFFPALPHDRVHAE